jgi:hypothetical protein
MQTRDGATYFVGKISGMLMSYNLQGDHPLVGCSAPDFEFEDGRRVGDLLHKGKGVLLDLAGSEQVRGLSGGCKDRLQQVSAKAKDSKGVTAMLVRPDGFVAWAADSEPNLNAAETAMALLFGGC